MIIAVCLGMGALGAIPLSAWLQVIHRHESFPLRHLEATEFIEAVYRHYGRTGQWPDTATATRESPLPFDWTYLDQVDSPDAQSAPQLYLTDPFDMSLVYYFLPPEGDEISRRWVMSFEGDKTGFEANPAYRD